MTLQRLPKGRTAPAAVPPVVHEVLRSTGQPLEPAARAFMEPRFGHNFSHIRVHTDQKAAESARAVDALAYTVGSNIVFGTGQYAWKTEQGRRLLAHELAHVVQQRGAPRTGHLSIGDSTSESEKAAGMIAEKILTAPPGPRLASDLPVTTRQDAGVIGRQVLQRAKISYRSLTWADFKATPPAGSPFAAETASGFDVPGWRAKEQTEDTKKKCTAGKKASTEFKATVSVNADLYDSVTATMVQENSWVKSRFKDGGKAFCGGERSACEKTFDTAVAGAKTSCAEHAKKCEEAFKNNQTSYELDFDGTKVKATSAADCTTTLVTGCEAQTVKGVDYTLTDIGGATYTRAATKADCAKGFLNDCLTHEAADSSDLLKHEQGHFDISKAMADKARPSLKAKAATFAASGTGCGKVAAVKAARDNFNKLTGVDDLDKLGQAWIASKKKAEDDYDDQTNHGLKKKEQAVWEAKIVAGLKDYDPTAPSAVTGAAATTPVQTPGAPTTP